MRNHPPFLPIRSLVSPARFGRRRRGSAFAAATGVCSRFEQNNLAVAMAARPVWLSGPLFLRSQPQPSVFFERHAA